MVFRAVKLDERGFAFTLDAVLALIPVLIVFAAVTTANYAPLMTSFQEARLPNTAQDSIEVMAHYKEDDGFSTLEDVSNTLKKNNNDRTGIKAAEEIAGPFLEKALNGKHYALTEENQLKGKVIASNAELKDARDVGIGAKSCGNYTFKLYVWN